MLNLKAGHVSLSAWERDLCSDSDYWGVSVHQWQDAGSQKMEVVSLYHLLLSVWTC